MMLLSSNKADQSARSSAQPWVEKYRPKTVDEVCSQEEVVEALRTALSKGSMPHLLFYGPPGTGKTSTILALAKDMFGSQFKQRVLELNASDERGISIVREKVKNFAQTAVSSSDGGPGFKLIILDEADAMTGDAQSALRRTMEKYTRVTRFCLICNYVSRIIEPLASRCAKFRFRPMPRGPMISRLEMLCTYEKVAFDTDALEALLEASSGDMRRAITLLQCASIYNAQKVDRESINEVSGVLPANALEELWGAVKSGLFDRISNAIRNILAAGFSSTMVIRQLYNAVLRDTGVPDYLRAHMLLKLAQTDKDLVDGADEQMQIMDVCCDFARNLRNNHKI